MPGRANSGGGRPPSPLASAKARATIIAVNRRRHLLPTCSATAKWTGERCKRFAMANGKCDVHGGKTPTGKRWHRMQPPAPSSPDAAKKAERKLRDQAKAKKRRAAILSQMTPEDRAEHEHWQRTHRPGDPKRRAADRARRQQDRTAADLIRQDRPTSPRSTERAALVAQIEALERQNAEAEAAEAYDGIFS